VLVLSITTLSVWACQVPTKGKNPGTQALGAVAAGTNADVGGAGCAVCAAGEELNKKARQGWMTATDRASRTRAYRISVNARRYTDVELAFAWLYQDVAHGDESTTGELGIVERYRAAVGVFSHVAVMSLRTLDYLKQLVEHGVLQLPAEAFSDDVIITDTEVVIDGPFYESEVGADLGDWESGGPLPAHFRPAFDAIHEMVQNGHTETDVSVVGDVAPVTNSDRNPV
jgi:hypothetical protein